MGFECYRIGDLLLDAGTQEVTRNGAVVAVPRLSFLLLLSLARHAPNVVTTKELEQEVWSGLVVDRGTVNKRALLLRKALGEDKGEDPYIAIVRGTGYRMVAPVERIECLQNGTSVEHLGNSSDEFNKRSRARTIAYLLLGMLALFVLYMGSQKATFDAAGPAPDPAVVGPIGQPPAIYSQKSIAVLPFVDLSDGQSHTYLGDGIAEEVINLLAGMDDLRVAARTSSFAFRDTPATTREISSQLKVGTILEGSIRHTAERIRVTAQLIDTQTGYHIWSQNYDRAFDEIFSVQDDIAFNIAQALKLSMSESREPRTSKATTENIEAFSFFLKGRELLNNRIHLRSGGLREALRNFRRSVELDPGFARAHADIAVVYWLLPAYDATLDQEDYFQRAEASANFALEFDPDSTDALGALAAISSTRGEIEKAVAYFERIRKAGNNDSNIVLWEAMLHIRLGYFDELINPLTEVYRLDPLNEHIGWVLATALNFSGEPEQATGILRQLENFTYRQYVLGLAAINQGDYALARELLSHAQMRSGLLAPVYSDLLVDALEHPETADEVSKKLVSAAEKGELDRMICFESLLIIGSPRAFDLGIDSAADVTNMQILAQVWNNWGVGMRQDPRFKDWVGKLGYVEFWRKYGWPDRCRPTGLENFECI